MSDILKVMIKIWDMNTTKEQLKQIKLVLLGFQNEYEGKVSSRGKPIIKKEYRLHE